MSSNPLLEPTLVPGDGSPGASEHAVSSIVHRIAAAIASGAIPPGAAADLRRLTSGDPASPAFWKVVAEYVAPRWQFPGGGVALDQAEQHWAVILNAIARLSALDSPRRPLGGALASAGFSELRFVRLLRATDDGLADTVRKTAHYLASKAEPANLADLADLVLSDGRDWGERLRRRVARSYYNAAPKP